MSCTTCGSNVNCNCTTNRISCGQSVSCSACNDNGCNSCSGVVGCNRNLVPASPQPYYNCAPSCQESNTQKVVFNQFAAALKVVNTWNVPACGLTAVLHIPGLISITIGSYLWNAQFGYFEVTAFDSGLQQVTVKNNCNEGNATAGTNVPACTLFLNAAPPAAEEPSNTPCVEIDFTAPAVGDCIDITLNNTNGVLAGDVVQIGSGFYRVSEVKPNDIINICNDGDGITPGTPVIAKDATGNYQYCLQIISTSPCDREVVEIGRVVVCNSDGQTTGLDVPENYWMLVGHESTNNTVSFQPIGLTPICTAITSPLDIIAGNAGYSIVVGSSVGFAVDDIIQIAGQPTLRFTITAIPDISHLTGAFTSVPVVSVLIPVGTTICRIGCCELLQNEIDDAVDALTCAPKIFRILVNPAYYTVPIVLNEDQYFATVFDTSLLEVNLGAPTCPERTYAITAHLSVAMVADYESLDSSIVFGAIYQEFEAFWSEGGRPPTRTAGKIVYTNTSVDSIGVMPTAPDATFSQLLSPGPNYPIQYNQADVEAYAVILPGNPAVTNLTLSYRTLVGSDAFLNTFNYSNMLFMISGWVDIETVTEG